MHHSETLYVLTSHNLLSIIFKCDTCNLKLCLALIRFSWMKHYWKRIALKKQRIDHYVDKLWCFISNRINSKFEPVNKISITGKCKFVLPWDTSNIDCTISVHHKMSKIIMILDHLFREIHLYLSSGFPCVKNLKWGLNKVKRCTCTLWVDRTWVITDIMTRKND